MLCVRVCVYSSTVAVHLPAAILSFDKLAPHHRRRLRSHEPSGHLPSGLSIASAYSSPVLIEIEIVPIDDLGKSILESKYVANLIEMRTRTGIPYVLP